MLPLGSSSKWYFAVRSTAFSKSNLSCCETPIQCTHSSKSNNEIPLLTSISPHSKLWKCLLVSWYLDTSVWNQSISKFPRNPHFDQRIVLITVDLPEEQELASIHFFVLFINFDNSIANWGVYRFYQYFHRNVLNFFLNKHCSKHIVPTIFGLQAQSPFKVKNALP